MTNLLHQNLRIRRCSHTVLYRSAGAALHRAQNLESLPSCRARMSTRGLAKPLSLTPPVTPPSMEALSDATTMLSTAHCLLGATSYVMIEGLSVIVDVYLDCASAGEVSVDWRLSTAQMVTPCSGSLTFAAGETVKFIKLKAADNDKWEITKVLSIRLSSCVGARLVFDTANIHVLDDDVYPTKAPKSFKAAGARQRGYERQQTVSLTKGSNPARIAPVELSSSSPERIRSPSQSSPSRTSPASSPGSPSPGSPRGRGLARRVSHEAAMGLTGTGRSISGMARSVTSTALAPLFPEPVTTQLRSKSWVRHMLCAPCSSLLLAPCSFLAAALCSLRSLV